MDPGDFTYPNVELDKYFPNFTGKCLVSFYEHEKDYRVSRICIVNVNNPFDFNLPDEKVALLEDFPPSGEVFAVDLGEDGLHRAVYNNGGESLFFIDCGEIVEVSGIQFKMFSLSERAKNTSARAIPCVVLQMTDEQGNQIKRIADIFSLHVSFTVLGIEGDKLVVKLSKLKPMLSDESDKPVNGYTEVTQEELDVLYEEPEMMTSNASRAVTGHDPQDDKRICPHYDPKTGGCFKGNQCRLEHVLPITDGWTRDKKEAMISLSTDIVPIVGSKVKVCVTSIASVEEFYVHIPEITARFGAGSLKELKRDINAVDMVKQYKQFVGVPNLCDLVLVKHEGTFYRGKVVDGDEVSPVVHFLDYGYTRSIHPKAIYQWYPRWNLTPAQSHRCCLGNVNRIEGKDDEATKAFRTLILTTGELSAEIISYSGDLFVHLYDANGVDVGETLSYYGLVELEPKIFPVSTGQVPG